jgi:hypothetical protein
MKGDFSRLTFRQDKHYSSVRMQQGRVLLDAEWNEQADIQAYRDRETARDVIGPCGAPFSAPGEFKNFQVRVAGAAFELADGRIYIDGTLCESERVVAYAAQPDFPNAPALVAGQAYVAYLDVWERHLTAQEQPEEEQPQLREVALGGPDTTTRIRTVWQAKVQALANAAATCADFDSDWVPDGAQSTGKLRAQAAPAQPAANDCLVPPGGGYRRLENQLYRVEIHQPGAPGTATYKWSRDNGSVLTGLVKTDVTVPTAPVITVPDPGKDAVLGFAAAAWVEISDEERTLRNEPGVLLAVDSVTKDRITLKNPASLALTTGTRPTVRRWDGTGTVQIGMPAAPRWIELEDGVMVEFADGQFRSGDYWTVPARSLTGKVGWSADANGPVFEGRHGVEHRYCPLALLLPSGGAWTVKDCRKLFPPLTGLTTLLYESGDGQEAMPSNSLPQPLRVRVVNGQAPVSGAQVQFIVTAGGGTLSVNAPVATVAPDGIAECTWTLGPAGSQQAEAVLLDAGGAAVPGQILHFNANLSIASQVSYDPTQCAPLAGATTLQDAIDRLCQLAGVPQEPGIHIEKVEIGGLEFHNDAFFPVSALAKGIVVTCDSQVSPRSLQNHGGLNPNPVCFVTLDLPYPLTSQDNEFWNGFHASGLLGHTPLILAGDVKADGAVIQWQPTGNTGSFLSSSLLPAVNQRYPGLPILAHLTLKGNYIWGPDDPKLYLDGEVFGVPGPANTEIKLPSGNSQGGGDFETWFWLTGERQIGLILKSKIGPVAVSPNLKLGLSMALDRGKLSQLVPAGYQVDSTQPFDPAKATALIKDVGLSGAALQVWAGKSLGDLAKATVDMLVSNAGLKPKLTALDDSNPADFVAKIQTATAAGAGPDVVIGDSNIADALGRASASVFDPGIVKF